MVTALAQRKHVADCELTPAVGKESQAFTCKVAQDVRLAIDAGVGEEAFGELAPKSVIRPVPVLKTAPSSWLDNGYLAGFAEYSQVYPGFLSVGALLGNEAAARGRFNLQQAAQIRDVRGNRTDAFWGAAFAFAMSASSSWFSDPYRLVGAGNRAWQAKSTPVFGDITYWTQNGKPELTEALKVAHTVGPGPYAILRAMISEDGKTMIVVAKVEKISEDIASEAAKVMAAMGLDIMANVVRSFGVKQVRIHMVD